MIKNTLSGVVAAAVVSACTSGPPTKNVIGLPINKVISAKYSPSVSVLEGDKTLYTVVNTVLPYQGPDDCTYGAKLSDPPTCFPGIPMDGSETTTAYTVDAKGIITDVKQDAKFIPYSAGSSTPDDESEEPTEPEDSLANDQAITDFFARVHKK